ncbi:MAG: hypothetical protein KBT21_00060 [Treponema sp.]|nr:hypothetical protein [Candidatus Treponema merdequi]
MSKTEKNINADLSAGLLNDAELNLICGGTEEGSVVVDLIMAATRAHAISIDCCTRLDKFYFSVLDSKGDFEHLILQAYIKEVITQDEFIAAKKYYIKRK